MKKIVILSLFLALLGMSCQASKMPKAPQFLKPGDKIAIITPASVIRPAIADTGYAVLKRWGLEPVMGKYVKNEYHGFAGTIAERKADLLWALRDKSIKAIICTRGGYGSVHLLCEIPLDTLRRYPKWIIGFSDITALLSAEVCAGNMGIHANMCEPLGNAGGNDTVSQYLHKLLMGKLPSYKIAAHKYNKLGTAHGILIGGNMSVYGGLAGSDYDFLNKDFVKDKDIILFIEDVSERIASVDRMLHLLEIRGVLSHIKGLIIGKYKDYTPADGYSDMYEMIHSYLDKYNIPMCYDFPVGHFDDQNYPLVEGCPATLKVQSDSVSLDFNLPK